MEQLWRSVQNGGEDARVWRGSTPAAGGGGDAHDLEEASGGGVQRAAALGIGSSGGLGNDQID